MHTCHPKLPAPEASKPESESKGILTGVAALSVTDDGGSSSGTRVLSDKRSLIPKP